MLVLGYVQPHEMCLLHSPEIVLEGCYGISRQKQSKKLLNQCLAVD